MRVTKRDLQERVAELEEAMERIHDLLDEALDFEDEENAEDEDHPE